MCKKNDLLNAMKQTGLDREKIMVRLYPEYATGSYRLRDSIKTRFNKLVSRSGMAGLLRRNMVGEVPRYE